MNSYETIKNVLREMVGEGVAFSLTSPDDVAHGEYATNVALIKYAFFSKAVGGHADEGIYWVGQGDVSNPKDLAERLKIGLLEKLQSVVKNIEVAGPGFINFFLRDEVIRKENEEGSTAVSSLYVGKNILVEHSSPNLFKPFSVGHLMNNIVGEFVARSMKVLGGNVRTMSFPSDVSLGIAKALLSIERDIKSGRVDVPYFETAEGNEVIVYLGEAYVRGVKECEEHEESLNEAKEILNRLYNLKDDDFCHLVSKTRQINETYFKNTLHGIGSEIDSFVYESHAGKVGEQIVKENTGEGKVFTESEGAIVYTPSEERKDINTSVFINSQGYPTYEAKDLGLIEIKFSNFATGLHSFFPDFSFFITDQEQANHFKVVLDAASKLGGEWPGRVDKSIHVPHGRMLFKGAKMSSRLGGVPLALDVLSVVEEEVRARAGEKIAHLGEEEKKKLEREISLSALRVAVLRSKPGININFDPETSLSFEGDSGPYLLYTHARCSSLLEKDTSIIPSWGGLPVTPLEKKLLHFERELVLSSEDLAPQKLVTYLFSVAQLFNSYYASTQIVVDGDNVGSAHRLMVVKRTKEVLKRGLYVLGIEAPERM